MKYLLVSLTFMMVSLVFSQGAYKVKKKKKDYFGGAKDYRTLANYGLQIQGGPTFTIAPASQTITSTNAIGENYEVKIDPSANIAGFIDIGLAHFNIKKGSLLRIGKLYHYFDYGLNFKVFSGTEHTEYMNYDAAGRELGMLKEKGTFYNAYAGARVTLHYLKYFQNGSKFLDNGLGINGEYMVIEGKKYYSSLASSNQYYSAAMRVNLHYNLGFGFRLKRGSYLIPNIQIPIYGFSESGHESIRWFSSKYYPVMIGVKLIRLFEKKGNGCTDNGTEEDRKKNQEYMQGK